MIYIDNQKYKNMIIFNNIFYPIDLDRLKSTSLFISLRKII